MIYNSDFCLKQHWFFALSGLLSLLLLVTGCQSKNNTPSSDESSEVVADTLPGDFVLFFNRFHEDSAYQLEHIIFPLEGLPPSSGGDDSLTSKRYYWQKADWKKHNPFTDPSGNFEHWYEVLNDRIIEHWVHMKGTNLHIKRRFAKLEDGWYLIYYQGLRPVDR
jgi:hypothetical protein